VEENVNRRNCNLLPYNFVEKREVLIVKENTGASAFFEY